MTDDMQAKVTETVARFNPTVCGMFRTILGHWVRFTDYEAIAARLAEVEAERDDALAFLDNAISDAPEPLTALGSWLANMLDEDKWPTAERYLNAAVKSLVDTLRYCEIQMQDADRVTHTKMLQERARAEAAEAERDRLAAELAEANAKITQITAGWGEDAVTVEELRAELAEARAAMETQRAALRHALTPVPDLDLPLQPYGDTAALAKGDTDDRA
jgi:hypothetical protein